jgi:hypothetical protein
MESSQLVASFQEQYAKLLVHNDDMREIEKEIEREQQEDHWQ